jgi:membrane-bound lytic murein transglycosylase D
MLYIRSLLLSFCVIFSLLGQAQEIEVPGTMEFAGIKLKIDSDARDLIGKNVWLLRKNEAYFNTTLERFDLYLPILQRVLAEEGLPDDFKYLALQESSMVSDVVSTSNAVGYWQFKQASAMEVGMRVDDNVDERKHIIASSRGAAKYIKRNNYYLKNWLSALLSHYAGLGGARNLLSADWMEATKLDIDKNTHWYILKFLAHKLAFEQSVGRNQYPNLVLLEYMNTNGKSLKQIARELDIDAEQLEFYNKWLSNSRIPEDKPYAVIVPASAGQMNELIAKTGSPYRPLTPGSVTVASVEREPIVTTASTAGAVFPVLKKKREDRMYAINGKSGIQARSGDTPQRLADLGDISKEKFLRFNDLKGNERLVAGQVYYLKKKRARAAVDEHVVTEGETMWEISQRYGIRLKSLLNKNRMARVEKLKHGRVLWLRSIRPSHIPVEIRNIPKPPTVMVAQNKTETKVPAVVKSTRTELPMVKEDLPVAPVISESPKVTTTAKPPILSSPVEKGEDISKLEDKALYTPTQPSSVFTSKPEVAAGKTHTVEQGQTLYGISRMYGATVSDIRTWNGLAEAEGVRIGQILIVGRPAEATTMPASERQQKPATEEFVEHVVQAGDTVYKISRTYGVSVTELLSWNGKTDATLALGEVLKVKKTINR